MNRPGQEEHGATCRRHAVDVEHPVLDAASSCPGGRTDPVTGQPLDVWTVIDDLRIRLARLEQDRHG